MPLFVFCISSTAYGKNTKRGDFVLTVLIRTAIIYFVAVFSLKMMGKRQVGEMQISELTTAVLMSELLAHPATNPDEPLIYGVIAIIVLVTLEITVSFFVTKSDLLARIFDNRPSIIIERGKLKQDALKRLRFGVSELISELRQKDISDIADVDYAILEPNGKISVFAVSDGGIAFTLVCDGSFCFSGMDLAKVTKKDVQKVLKKQKLSLSEVFLMTKSPDGSYKVIKKEIR